MIKRQFVEPGKIVTILFKSPSSKPLEVIINTGRLTRHSGNPIYISPQAPLAQAIAKHKAGDNVQFQSPEGKLEVKILNIKN